MTETNSPPPTALLCRAHPSPSPMMSVRSSSFKFQHITRSYPAAFSPERKSLNPVSLPLLHPFLRHAQGKKNNRHKSARTHTHGCTRLHTVTQGSTRQCKAARRNTKTAQCDIGPAEWKLRCVYVCVCESYLKTIPSVCF